MQDIKKLHDCIPLDRLLDVYRVLDKTRRPTKGTAYARYRGARVIDTEDRCAICFSDFTATDDCVTTHCGSAVDHVYHRQCIDLWLERSDKCPMCNGIMSDDGNFDNFLERWMSTAVHPRLQEALRSFRIHVRDLQHHPRLVCEISLFAMIFMLAVYQFYMFAEVNQNNRVRDANWDRIDVLSPRERIERIIQDLDLEQRNTTLLDRTFTITLCQTALLSIIIIDMINDMIHQ